MPQSIAISTWQPWNLTKGAMGSRYTPNELLAPLSMIGPSRRLAIKGVDLFPDKGNEVGLYGVSPEWDLFDRDPYRGRSNDDLEQAAKGAGFQIEIWVYIRLEHPHDEAQAIHKAVKRWQPLRVYLDVEREAKPNGNNTGPFLRSLGRMRLHDGTRVQTVLQSYRLPEYHREIVWHKWLTYKDGDEYVVDAIGPQAYYQGSQDSVVDYGRMLDQHAGLLERAGRPEMPWLPTLPTYSEHGWTPSASSLEKGIQFLIEELGDRLLGFNFFRLGFLLEERFQDHLAMLASLDLPEPTPPEPAGPLFLELPDREKWQVVLHHFREEGLVDQDGRLPVGWGSEEV